MMSLWINGEWLAGSGAARQSANPVTGEATWAGNDASPLQVEQAVAAARAAFPAWARRPFAERQHIIEVFAALLESHKEA